MALHAKYYRNNFIYYDGPSWIDVIGPNVVKVSEHFTQTPFASADNMAGWTTTLVEAGAGDSTVALMGGADGGQLLITTDAADNDGVTIQLQGEAFKALTYPIYFGCRFQVDEATQNDFLIGLCITDTDLLGGMTDGIYFRKVDASTTMSFVLEKNSTETVTNYGTAIAANTWYTIEFYFDGTNVDWFVNGVLQTRPAITNLCDDEHLTVSVHFLTGEAVAHTMNIDFIRAFQILA